MRFGTIAIIILTILAASLVLAQNTPVIKQVPLQQTSPVSGQEMFSTYCAVCHGANAKGDGPAVAALKKSPGDITKLALHNHGKFPDERVSMSITGSSGIAAHGSNEMPIWGDLFRSINSDRALTRLRIANLTDYLKSIQSK
jgi:mono/diheme cytochrome c family protein